MRADHRKTAKSKATQAALIAAAKELAIKRGLEDFTLREVCNLAGVTKAALYYYFADKNELLDAIFISEAEEVATLIREILERENIDARRRLEELIRTCCVGLCERSMLAMALSQSLMAHPELVERKLEPFVMRLTNAFVSCLDEGKREGTIKRSSDSVTQANMIVGGSLVCILHELRNSQDASGDVIANHVITIMTDGIFNGD